MKMMCVVTVDMVCVLVGEPYKRGFFCSDTDIRYPFLDSSVPWCPW